MNASRTNTDFVPAVPDGVSAVRAGAANITLSLLAAVVVVAGSWGAALSFGDGPAPVSIGDEVEVREGSFRVDGATPEHMAPMQSGKFAASGMSMSAMGMDMAPEGHERLAVEVTLTGDEGESLSYSPEGFRVSGDGMGSVAPIRDQLEAGTLSGGSSVSGGMVFEVPEKAENLVLDFEGGRSVSLDVPPKAGGNAGSPHGH
ncbi:MAG: DUF4352 domain-containing protein [Actinomycetota bacterium]|nr:DUF4352 domain-containing protein [Rubrobacter sp.]MDQ3507584.1 DUF4352 domain-containing protein [Actinomycetota bacterium]